MSDEMKFRIEMINIIEAIRKNWIKFTSKIDDLHWEETSNKFLKCCEFSFETLVDEYEKQKKKYSAITSYHKQIEKFISSTKLEIEKIEENTSREESSQKELIICENFFYDLDNLCDDLK